MIHAQNRGGDHVDALDIPNRAFFPRIEERDHDLVHNPTQGSGSTTNVCFIFDSFFSFLPLFLKLSPLLFSGVEGLGGIFELTTDSLNLRLDALHLRLHLCQCPLGYLGNPFRSFSIDLTSGTPAVLSIAQSIYDERTFDRMSELTDALEKASCTDKDIIDHCRGLGPHVRGCWSWTSYSGNGDSTYYLSVRGTVQQLLIGSHSPILKRL